MTLANEAGSRVPAPAGATHRLARVVLEDFTFVLPVALRWSDLDTLSHVNNARFLTFDEQARLTYFEAVAKADTGFWHDYGLILARSQIDFIAQMHYPAELKVGYRVERIGRSSLVARAGLFTAEGLCGVVESVIVTFDYKTQKPVPVPETFRKVVRNIEGEKLVEA